MNTPRQDLERSTDVAGIEPEEDSKGNIIEPDDSDVFELRFCEIDGCGEPLPTDKPAKRITIRGEKVLVCASCHARARDFH